MNRETIKQKLSVIISSENITANEKQDKITELFETEQYYNMQFYMEYCQRKGYVTPHKWIAEHKHF